VGETLIFLILQMSWLQKEQSLQMTKGWEGPPPPGSKKIIPKCCPKNELALPNFRPFARIAHFAAFCLGKPLDFLIRNFLI